MNTDDPHLKCHLISQVIFAHLSPSSCRCVEPPLSSIVSQRKRKFAAIILLCPVILLLQFRQHKCRRNSLVFFHSASLSFSRTHHNLLNKFSPSSSPHQRGICHNAATSMSKTALGTCFISTSAWLTSPAILCTFGMFCFDIGSFHIVCTSMLCVFQVHIVVRLLAHSSCLQTSRLCGSLVSPSNKILASVELNDIVG